MDKSAGDQGLPFVADNLRVYADFQRLVPELNDNIAFDVSRGFYRGILHNFIMMLEFNDKVSTINAYIYK